MSLLKPRFVFKPFEYEEAFNYWEMQQNVHWLPSEVSMSKDIADWMNKMTDAEKNVVGNVLKGFTQTEVVVQDYWTNMVTQWFPKPEIAMMATAFGAMETVHATGYAYLNDSLGLDDYDSFIQEPTVKAKIDRLTDVPDKKNKKHIARSLAIFSAFTEGVNLFSSFAILMSFSLSNKLKGMKQIVSWSIRDESLHSKAGCWLFRTFIKENPGIWTDDLKRDIYEAAHLTVKLEEDFIDKCFELGSIENLDPNDLKQYIRYRTNTKLQDIMLKPVIEVQDKEAVERLHWFDVLSSGKEFQDFFAQQPTTYSKGVNNKWTIDHIFEGVADDDRRA